MGNVCFSDNTSTALSGTLPAGRCDKILSVEEGSVANGCPSTLLSVLEMLLIPASGTSHCHSSAVHGRIW